VSGFPHNFIVQSLAIVNENTSKYCERHTDEIALKFCFDCNCLLCDICASNHPLGHNERSIKDADAYYNQQIDEVVGELLDFMPFKNYTRQLRNHECMFHHNVESVKQDIIERGRIMKNAIDRHVKLLVKGVTDHETEISKEFCNKSASVQTAKHQLRNLKAATKELKTAMQLNELSSAIANIDTMIKNLKDELSRVDFEIPQWPEIHFEPIAGQQLFNVFNFQKNCLGSLSVIVPDKGILCPILFFYVALCCLSISHSGVGSIFGKGWQKHLVRSNEKNFLLLPLKILQRGRFPYWPKVILHFGT